MLSVVVPTLIGWQIQVRRNPLFINVADCSSTRQFDPPNPQPPNHPNQRGTVSLAVVDGKPRQARKRCPDAWADRAYRHGLSHRGVRIGREGRKRNNNVSPKPVFQGCDEYMPPS
jgi:hypothetical protein